MKIKNQVWEWRQERNEHHIGTVVVKTKNLIRLLINFANIYKCHLHRLNQGPWLQICIFCGLIWPFKWVLEIYFFSFFLFFLEHNCSPTWQAVVTPKSSSKGERRQVFHLHALLGFNPEIPYWWSQAPAGLYQWAVTHGVGFLGFSPWSQTQVWG